MGSVFPPLSAPESRGDHWAWEYKKETGSYASTVEELGRLSGKQVLDFSCGWGGESAWLAERACRGVGCDIDADSIAEAEAFKRRAIT